MIKLEKIGLMILLNYFNQMGTVKNHLQLALKQVLLAMQASMEIIKQAPPTNLLGGNRDTINLLFGPIQKILEFSIEKVEPAPEFVESEKKLQEAMKIKGHILSSIISVIDDEIENTRNVTSEKSKLKIEALSTVKQVLLTQCQQTTPTSTITPKQSRVA